MLSSQSRFSYRGEMDFFKSHYYGLNRQLLVLIGQWPYQKKRQRLILSVVILVILLLAVVMQVPFAKFLTVLDNVRSAAEVLQILVPCLMFVVNYCNNIFNCKKMKKLLDHIRHDWTVLTNVPETAILRKYAKSGRLYTLAFIIIFYSICCGFIVITNIPYIYDIVLRSNVTRSLRLPIETVLPFSEETYFYPILTAIYMIVILGCHIVVAALTLFNAYVQHACGMYSVIGYQLMHVFDPIADDISIIDENKEIYKEMVGIVRMHQRIIRFITVINSCYATTYLIQLVFLIVLLSVDIYQIFQAIKSLDDWGNIVIYLLFVCGALSAVAIVCVAGQDILNHSNHLFDNAYTSQWFVAPIKSRKLLLQIMIRAVKPTPIASLQSYPASMELFDTALHATMTYFMALYSCQ